MQETYEVQVVATAVVFTTVTVKADSPAEADSLAVQKAQNGNHNWYVQGTTRHYTNGKPRMSVAGV